MMRALLMAGVVAGGWMLYALAVFLGQRALMFPAPPTPAAGAPRGVAAVMLPIAGATIEAWLLRPAPGAATPAPVVIFTHGNGELIDFWAGEFEEWRAAGFAVLLVEYPGYGRSTGSPTEQSVTDGVLAAYDWVTRVPGIDAARIVAYGRSLGGGAACALVAKRPVAALVLESTWTSSAALAPRMLLPGALVRDRFDNVAALRGFTGPMLVMHGDHDTTIPTSLGRQLAASVPGARLELLPCGHNDCRGTFAMALSFLAARGLSPAGVTEGRPVSHP